MDICGTVKFHPGMMKTYLDKKANVKLAPMGLTSSNVRFLIAVRKDEGVSLKELTSKILVDKALTTRNIQLLIDKGLLENRGAGREYSLYLTKEGREAEMEVRKIRDEVYEDLLGCLTPEEKRELNRLLDKLMVKISEEACR